MRSSSRRVTLLSVLAVTSLVTLLWYWGLYHVPATVESASRGSGAHSSSSDGRERARRALQRLAVAEVQRLRSLTPENAEHHFRTCSTCMYLLIVDNAVARVAYGPQAWGSRMPAYLQLVDDILLYHSVPDTVVVIDTSDHPQSRISFNFNRRHGDSFIMMLPNHRFAVNDIPVAAGMKSKKWNPTLKALLQLSQQAPYASRDDRLFMDGIPHRDKKLYFDIACRQPDVATAYIHAGSVHFERLMRGEEQRLECYRQAGLLLNTTVPFATHNLRHKFLVYAHGNSLSDRLRLLLPSGSVVFKPDEDRTEFFRAVLQPYRHYIPVARDYSDLLEKRQWALAHPQACERMVRASRQFAEDFLEYSNVMAYAGRLLTEYARWMQNFPWFTADPKRVCSTPWGKDMFQC